MIPLFYSAVNSIFLTKPLNKITFLHFIQRFISFILMLPHITVMMPLIVRLIISKPTLRSTKYFDQHIVYTSLHLSVIKYS